MPLFWHKVENSTKNLFHRLFESGAISAFLLCIIPANGFASGPETEIAKIYGAQIEFEVLRDGTPVGRHQVHFEEHDDGLKVTSEMSLIVRLFTIPVYKFRYTAVEYWRQGRLHSLQVDVDDDGDKHRIEAKRNQEKMSVAGPDGPREFSGGIFPTSHWNSTVLRQQRVLNTITGRINNVEITKAAFEDIEVGDGTRLARRYQYSGDLSVTAWYDTAGRWIKLSFMAKDGSQIEYRCVICKTDG